MVDPRTSGTAHEHRLLRVGDEAGHPATFVGLKVGDDDIRQSRRVEYLGHRGPHLLVNRVHAGVNEGGPLVVDHELIEADAFVRREDADPVNAVSNLVDSRHRASSFHVGGHRAATRE